MATLNPTPDVRLERKFRLADLCCCSGGAGHGYKRAGFHVVGFDYKPQRRYAGDEFRCVDVLSLDPAALATEFDAFHASPPCQFCSEVTPDRTRHINLIPDVRRILVATGKPYVIENVRKAAEHLRNPVSLLGQMFDLHLTTSTGQRFDLSRERLFETNWPVVAPPMPSGSHPIANVFGGHLRARSRPYRTGKGTGRTVDFPGEDRPTLARQLMGMPWASMHELSEAVPPAYTEWLGRQMIAHLSRAVAA